jgi:hypothetical protein
MSAKREMILDGNIVLKICIEICAVWAIAPNIIVLYKQLLRTSLCIMTVSMYAPLIGQAGFRNSNSVKCFLAHLARPLAWSCDTIGSWWSQQEYVVSFSFEVDWKCTWRKWDTVLHFRTFYFRAPNSDTADEQTFRAVAQWRCKTRVANCILFLLSGRKPVQSSRAV